MTILGLLNSIFPFNCLRKSNCYGCCKYEIVVGTYDDGLKGEESSMSSSSIAMMVAALESQEAVLEEIYT